MKTWEEFVEELNKCFERHQDEKNLEDPSYIDDDFCYECNVWLITEGGSCNWNNIHKLQELGYKVYAGEKDSFGWLTGCIKKDGLILVYG